VAADENGLAIDYHSFCVVSDYPLQAAIDVDALRLKCQAA
jgi:hypothetical protein